MPFPFPFTLYGASRASNIPSDPSCDFTYCYGGDWVQGKVGNYGMKFIGDPAPGFPDDGYVSVPDNPSIQFGDSDDFTVACWVSSSFGTYYQGFVSKKVNNAGALNYEGWTLFRTSDGMGNDNYMGVSIGSVAPNTRGLIYTDDEPDDTWHHLVMTRNGTSKVTNLWLDGVEQADSTTARLDDSGNNMRLGKWWASGLDYGLDGKLDEVAIWDTILTPAQISLLSTGSARADSFTPPAASAGNWVTGKIGDYALEFDGSSEVVNVPSGSGLSTGQTPGASAGGGSESFTVSAWVYQDTWTTWDSIIARKNGTWYNGWGLTSDGGTTGKVCFWFGGFANTAGNKSYATISTGQWHHLVGTYDPSAGSNGQVQIWVDGVAQTAADRWVNASAGPDTGQTEIGEFWDGKIDDMGCWDVVLDSGAIAALYNSGTGSAANSVSSSNLTSYWSFDSGGPGSSTLTDSSTLYTNNGALSGMSAGTTGSLLLYYDFEIGDSNPVSGNFPANDLVYDVVTASFHGPTAHTGTMSAGMSVADFGAWGQGKLGKYSFLCDGADDSIEIVSSSYLPLGDGNESFSISLWANNTEALGSYEALVGRHDYLQSSFTDGYSLRYNDTAEDKLIFTVGKWLTSAATADCAWNSAIDTTFRHVVATYDHVADESKIYLNGTPGTTGAKAAPTTVAGTHNTKIGRGGTAAGYVWPGNIDEVAFYNVALDSGAISDLYNSGHGAKASTVSSSALVCYLDMECDGPGSTNVLDLSGNDLSGTLNADAGTCGAG